MEHDRFARILGIGCTRILVCFGVVLAPLCASAQNLLQNPGFELGNVGFSSDYHYTPPVCCLFVTNGDYTVINNPSVWNPLLVDIADHTRTGNKMLVVDGYPGITVWQQTVTNILPGTTYGFRFWSQYLDPFHQKPTTLQVQIDFTGTWNTYYTVTLPVTVDRVWRSYEFLFDTPATSSLSIRIIDLQASANGNDFALDDMELGRCVTPVLQPLDPAMMFRPLGRGASMTVEASVGLLLNHQWLRNGVPLVNGWTSWGTFVSGATTSTLGLADLHMRDRGSYTCIVSSSCGGLATSTATVLSMVPLRTR